MWPLDVFRSHGWRARPRTLTRAGGAGQRSSIPPAGGAQAWHGLRRLASGGERGDRSGAGPTAVVACSADRGRWSARSARVLVQVRAARGRRELRAAPVFTFMSWRGCARRRPLQPLAAPGRSPGPVGAGATTRPARGIGRPGEPSGAACRARAPEAGAAGSAATGGQRAGGGPAGARAAADDARSGTPATISARVARAVSASGPPSSTAWPAAAISPAP